MQGMHYPAERFGAHESSDLNLMDRAEIQLSRPNTGAALKRKMQTARRLQWIQERWNDDAYFDAVVSAGRYLKLCNLLEWATTNDEEAEFRLQREIEAADGGTRPI